MGLEGEQEMIWNDKFTVVQRPMRFVVVYSGFESLGEKARTMYSLETVTTAVRLKQILFSIP